MIEIQNLKKVYGDRTVLDIPYLKIENHEKLILTGHNGSGKSTFLKILAGIIKADAGSVSLDGQLYYLPQQSIPFDKSVRKNILYALEGNKKEKETVCEEILKRLNLTHLKNKNAKTLSGGECQRLALGRVLAKKGDILLLDEPTSAADSESAKLIQKEIENYCKETGCILIMTTHSREEAESIDGRKIIFSDGKIC